MVCIRGQAADFVFNRDVRPILSEHCFQCHGPDEATREADLRLDIADSLISVVQPGDIDASELARRIASSGPDEQMPPPESKRQLSAGDRQTLLDWIESGAAFEEHWAFVRPQAVRPPDLEKDDWSSGPIDQFVLDRIRRAGLHPSPRADRQTLIRRITLDLTGLPPTPGEVDAFLADKSVAQGQVVLIIGTSVRVNVPIMECPGAIGRVLQVFELPSF